MRRRERECAPCTVYATPSAWPAADSAEHTRGGIGQFPTGANFAVLGSTALSWDYYKIKYSFAMPAPSHLDLQLDSFKKVLARIAPGDAAVKSLLGESLVVMGEIGGNDYNFWFFNPKNPRETPNQYMPDVVSHIGAAVQQVINLGAKAVLVPGNFPIGCVPQYLSMFQSNTSTDYDEHGCLVWFNECSKKHNQLLQQEVDRLRSQNPGVKIIFADYFGAAMQFVQNSPELWERGAARAERGPAAGHHGGYELVCSDDAPDLAVVDLEASVVAGVFLARFLAVPSSTVPSEASEAKAMRRACMRNTTRQES
ncbi:GDSL esterase/lipase [Dichanthelium oligosanthes]|uniref:GDSL esterase/lipase n=1 Tax=Dichanthelium oligosanthes TaxID=888268 RepID=A0A1E5WG08_9POAL|nr:GDSL esterase/lipase [Dichanthelium oligosanthes]